MVRSRAMGKLDSFFGGDKLDLDALAKALDAMTEADRLDAAMALDRSQQARLFDAARGFKKISIDDFVPSAKGTLSPVIHHGRNSLPLFTRFQKRFCRAPEESAKRELWGYNEQTMKAFTGPGYFVAYDIDDGEVNIDYTRVPPKGAPGWPDVLPNSAKLSRFIYNGTQDRMRGVSAHVTIGRASRAGKDMDNWFVLVREG
jgi:hypothetical protein